MSLRARHILAMVSVGTIDEHREGTESAIEINERSPEHEIESFLPRSEGSSVFSYKDIGELVTGPLPYKIGKVMKNLFNNNPDATEEYAQEESKVERIGQNSEKSFVDTNERSSEYEWERNEKNSAGEVEENERNSESEIKKNERISGSKASTESVIKKKKLSKKKLPYQFGKVIKKLFNKPVATVTPKKLEEQIGIPDNLNIGREDENYVAEEEDDDKSVRLFSIPVLLHCDKNHLLEPNTTAHLLFSYILLVDL